MTTNHHDPIVFRSPANAETFNEPMAQLDQALTAQAAAISAAQGDITTLEGQMSTAQGNISTLQGQVSTAESDITTLEGQMATAEGDITTLEGQMATAQGDISTLESQVAAMKSPVALCGRLTHQSGKPIPDTPLGGVETIYFTPYLGNVSMLYDGAQLVPVQFAELPLSLDYGPGVEMDNNYDVYLVDDNGTLRIGFGPAWASATARGAGNEIALINGVWVNAQAMYLTCGLTHIDVSVNQYRATYLGSFRATDGGPGSPTGDGKTSDSEVVGYIYNAYNQVDRKLRTYTENEHSYETSITRDWNNTRETELSVLVGLPGQVADLFVIAANEELDNILMVLETTPHTEEYVALGRWLGIFIKSGSGRATCGLGLNTSIVREIGGPSGYANNVAASMITKR